MIAVALVLSAVFIPTAFITGITGQFFRQFALTIAVSTIISAFNSLTMSPALGVLLLRPHGEQNDIVTRFFSKTLGWFFRAFNKSFDWIIARYGTSVAGRSAGGASPTSSCFGLKGLGTSFVSVTK